MQCRDIAEVLEQEGLSPLPDAARAHVARCSHCQDYISDLETIVSAAREWPTEVEPPPRVWMALPAPLEQESIFKEPPTAPNELPASWWGGFGQVLPTPALANGPPGAADSPAAD